VQTLKKYAALYCAIMICWVGGAFAETENKPQILTTTTDLADIAKVIVGNRASVSSIASGGEDPHFLSARPGYIVRARDADAWIRVGLELEVGWEGPILRDSRNRKIQAGASGHIDASTDVLVLDVPKQQVTRDMGDIHPHGNPHYWLDPLNGRIIARTIAMRLGDLFPEHAAAFQDNFKLFEHQLDVAMFGSLLVKQYGGDHLWSLLLEEKPLPDLASDGQNKESSGWYGRMKPYMGNSIVTYHRSWIYLAHRFGLQISTELEPKPGIPPSSKHLAKVVETIRTDQIRVILQEPFYSRKAADFVTRHTGTAVVICPNTVNGSKDATSYLQLIDHIVGSLAVALERGR
jgi:ABC-type Zn uptake system ZnuABC Zn-binding protein ZnuA